jgi:serine/threonine protein kinase/tetratricopeptide (TPR) repeat protein
MPVESGTKFGPYEIESQLGAGGMGEVYRARDTRLGRTVAIKILPAHLVGTREAKERFDREARSISSVSHPAICHLYDVGTQDGISYLVMEYLEGETLADRLNQGPIPFESLVKMALEITEGLDKAHRAGLVHRDLKPANLFLTQDGHVKILDFGLAKSLEALGAAAGGDGATAAAGLNFTSPGLAVGTIAYMSPEQARGEPVDCRSDLFSLGVVLYEMASARKAFGGSATATIFDAILNRQPQALTEINQEMPPAFASLVNRLMAKNARDRYVSAREVCDGLAEMQRSRMNSSSGRTRAQTRIPSIAVLPFANLSADPDSQYFSDGLSEDLISGLTRLQGLLVASRTSAFRFRGGNLDIREIGRQLNVEAVLEGSVRRAGQRLRITAQLVNVADGYQLWSERYDREITDIFAIQDEITTAIIRTLEPTLLGQQVSVTTRHSENVQAYELYLKGRRYWEQRSESGLRAGLECFRTAVDLDPNYGLAYLGIADSFTILAVYGYIAPSDGRPRAEAALKKALELNPDLPEGWFTQGMAATIFGAHAVADSMFQRGIEVMPRSSILHAYLGLFYGSHRRPAEALEYARKATELDPQAALIRGINALSLQCVGVYDEAMREADHALALQPNHVLGLWAKMLATCHAGQYSMAIELGERLCAITRRAAVYLGLLGMAHAKAGQPEKAHAMRDELTLRKETGEFVGPIAFLAIDYAVGDWQAARADLEAYDGDAGNGWGMVVMLGSYVDDVAAQPLCANLMHTLLGS